MASFDLVVTCHEPYRVKFLDTCVAAWDRQRVPGRKLLVGDGFSESWSRPGWDYIAGSWGHPSPARMAGMAATDAPWIVFFDADNVPPVGYADAIKMALKRTPGDVGVICPSWTSGDPRDVWGVDTNCPWRREAILEAGGWDVTTLEDWRLGWKLHAKGWRIKRLVGPRFVRRKHEQQRTFEADINEKLWEARDFGIITLLRGDKDLTLTWLDAFESQKKPARLGLTVTLDCDDEFRTWFKAQAETRLAPFLRRLTYVQPSSGRSIDATMDVRNRLQRHARVAWLYQEAIQRTPEPWILTWEDDVEPLSIDLLYRMNGKLTPSSRVGSVCPVYRERFREKACLSSHHDAWIGGISMRSALDGGFREIGAHPAGFALWCRSDLEHLDAKKTWDFEACKTVRSRGRAPFVFPEEVRHIVTWAEGEIGGEIPLNQDACRIETVNV